MLMIDVKTTQDLLVALGLIDLGSVEQLYPRVRDRDDVRVMVCRKSGIVFTLPIGNISETPHAIADGFSYWNAENRTEGLRECAEDDRRRARCIELLVRNRRWLDFGTGLGGILDLLRPVAQEIWAVEAQPGPRHELVELGFQAVEALAEVPDDHFDVITMFHVLEHLSDPLDTLQIIRRKLRSRGTIVIEVPHARDFLLTSLALEAFKRFTFWSEHKILHTRSSLEAFLRVSGYADIEIQGVQRYPLANHLHWLSQSAPAGHVEWSYLRQAALDEAYASLLTSLDRSDTLMAFASANAGQELNNTTD